MIIMIMKMVVKNIKSIVDLMSSLMILFVVVKTYRCHTENSGMLVVVGLKPKT